MATTRKYAEGTKVSIDTSLSQIRAALKKWGLVSFATAETETVYGIVFEILDREGVKRRYRMTFPLPDRAHYEQYEDRYGNVIRRSEAQISALYDAELQRLYRSLRLGVQAKLVMVDDGFETIEEAFYPYTVMPNNRTVYEETAEAVNAAVSSGKMQPLLPGYPAAPPKQIAGNGGPVLERRTG